MNNLHTKIPPLATLGRNDNNKLDNKTLENFIIVNSPDGGFLQSNHWRKFQESVGRKTFGLSEKDESGDTLIYAYVIAHKLPVVGKYFYVPRGPVVKNQRPKTKDQNHKPKFKNFIYSLVGIAQQNNIGWIRVEPNSDEELDLIKESLPGGIKIKKSSVDVQPREILILDISKSEEEILAGMKQKTRYNVRLAEKRGVYVTCNTQHVTRENIENFLWLVKITSERDKITPHPESYYRKMFEMIPPEILKLYVAEYEGKIIVANLVLFFGKTAIYMHGASDNIHRDAMAPYLLQWRQIQDAKKAGCTRYDFGGVRTLHSMEHGTWNKSWEGITKFKTGFAPDADPFRFPGCYDIVIKTGKYSLYRILQRIRKIF